MEICDYCKKELGEEYRSGAKSVTLFTYGMDNERRTKFEFCSKECLKKYAAKM